MRKLTAFLLGVYLLCSVLAPTASAEGEQSYTNTYSVDWIAMSAPAVGSSVSEGVQSLSATFIERVSFLAESTGVRDNIELCFDPDEMSGTLSLVLALFSMQIGTEAGELADRHLSVSDQRLLGDLYWQAFDADITVTETLTPTGEYAADGTAVYESTASETISMNCADYALLARRLELSAEERETMVTIAEETDFSPLLCDNLKSRTTEARRLLRQMSEEGVSLLRRAAADSALSLLGKVSYFWGGKSDAIGWDMRWNLPRIVTSAGARDSGRMESFGLDCSGFVSWALRNGAAKCSVEADIPEGTGKLWQCCRQVTWDEAEVGDLCFADVGSAGTNHVGMIVGRNKTGEWLVCHCDSGGVMLSPAGDFAYVCSPRLYEEETDAAN